MLPAPLPADEKALEKHNVIRNAWNVAAWADEIRETPLAGRICHEPVRASTGPAKCVAHFTTCVPSWCAAAHGAIVGEPAMRLSRPDLDRSGACVRVPGQTRILEAHPRRSFPWWSRTRRVDLDGDPAKAMFHHRPLAIHNDTKNWPQKHRCIPSRPRHVMVDNLMDLTHLGYVHISTSAASGRNTSKQRCRPERTPLGLKFTRWMLNRATTDLRAGVGFRPDRPCQRFEFIAPARSCMDGRPRRAYREGDTAEPLEFRLYHG